MTGFNYTVKGGDSLTRIFLEKAEDLGYEGDKSQINWTSVMSIFDVIQEEEVGEGEHLYCGGNDKTSKGWGTSYKLHVGDIIKLTKDQIAKIYNAMGFEKIKAPAGDAGAVEQPEETPTVNVEVPRTGCDKVYNEKWKNAYSIKEALRKELTSSWVNHAKVETELAKLKKDPVLAAMVVDYYGDDFAKDIDEEFCFGRGFDKETFYDYVLQPLLTKAKELDEESTISKDSSLEEMQVEATKLAKLVLNHEYNEVAQSEDYKKRESIQKVFDDANYFLAEVANMTPQPKITSGTNSKGINWKQVELSDGRWIKVEYDKSGEISKIKISHDTAEDVRKDGSRFDGNEISYTQENAWYDTDKSNGGFEDSIGTGYDFDELKALAENIFGKWEQDSAE